MRIAVVGTGYVGLVSAVGLSALGHKVIGIDIDPKKISILQKGKSPIYEPGLEKLLRAQLRSKRIIFTTDMRQGVSGAQVVIIAVGTPSQVDGSADLQYVFSAVRMMAPYLGQKTIVVDKSTVPIGAGDRVAALLVQETKREVQVVSCPEFLREGKAVEDFFHPDRIVVGGESKSTMTVAGLFSKLKAPFILTTLRAAEMIKYASNAFLATKISFINEIANVCELVGVDVGEVAKGMGADPRIGPAFLHAGIGYGGSCFPKDVYALRQIAGGHGYHFHLLASVIEVNHQQRLRFYHKIKSTLGSLRGKHIAVFGLAFKGDTDDVRESAAMDIVRWLVRDGAKVKVYDPKAMIVAQQALGETVVYAKNNRECVRDAEAVVIATEWSQFLQYDWIALRRQMRGKKWIFDGKRILADQKLKNYLTIGSATFPHHPTKAKKKSRK